MSHRAGRAIGSLLAAVTVLLLLAATPAAAHNELRSSDPAAGATLDAAPSAVTLTFGEELAPGQLTVTITGPDGAVLVQGQPQLRGPTGTVGFAPAAAGAYTVAYQVTASDGDTTSGSFAFTLTAAAVTAPTAATTTTPASAATIAGTSPSLATPGAAQDDDAAGSGSAWWPYVVIGLALILVVAIVYLLRSRRAAD